ncbi:hypothetical protein [Dactylosporangium sp. NPDC005555]|uniref:hypothetical protein n=1 Tax=Dactylosporangium sp. NPDC005555 TaxID=3154889 RepID=UPI00339E428D
MWTTPAARVAAVTMIAMACAGCTAEKPPAEHRSPAVAGPVLPPPAAGLPVHPSTSPTALHGSWDVSQVDDPCRTLTQQEAEQVLAIPVDPPRKVESWPPVCAFGLTPGFGPLAPGGTPAVTEYLYLLDDSQTSGREDFERGRSNPAVVEAVTGIGDEAYWTPDKYELQVMSGKTHVITKFSGRNPPADARAKAIAVTRISLPRARP